MPRKPMNKIVEETQAETETSVLSVLDQKEQAILEGLHKKYVVPIKDEKIVLVCKDAKMRIKGIRCMIQPPVERSTGKLFTGQPIFTEEEKRYVPHIVTKDTTRILQGKIVLDLSNPIDAIDWVWMREHPYINAKFGKNLWEVEDTEKQVKEKLSKEKKAIKLKSALLELALSEKRKIVRVFAGNSEDTENAIDTFLLDLVDKNVKMATGRDVSQIYEDKEYLNNCYFAYLLIDKGEVSINLSNYLFRDKVIATDFEGYLMWLNEASNKEVVSVLRSKYRV